MPMMGIAGSRVMRWRTNARTHTPIAAQNAVHSRNVLLNDPRSTRKADSVESGVSAAMPTDFYVAKSTPKSVSRSGTAHT
ncbi:MAG: hypothetical protein ACI80N_000555, partial [Gammaproteobacteria bacterium]